MSKVVSAQAPFTMIVATLTQGSDPSLGPAGNPNVSRQTVTMQYFPEIPVPGGPNTNNIPSAKGVTTHLGNLAYPGAGGAVRATGTITVASATFQGPTSILLGEYIITSDEHYTVDPVSVNNTATALAAAIDALPEYAATPAGAVVSISGLIGPQGNMEVFRSVGVSPANFTLAPTGGVMSGAEPVIGPITSTP